MKKEKSEIPLFIKKYPLIFKRYKPLKKIGKGAFSEIYSGINIYTNEKVAIKIEKRNSMIKYLEAECYTLFSLNNIGIPKVLSFGHNAEYDILIMPLLGKSLLDIFISKNSNYEFKDICLIGIQIIERIQWVHSCKIVHRDIKPENFLIGLSDPHILYLIDFGLSKKYQSTKTGRHIKITDLKKFIGSIIFSSVNSLRLREQSRRDDLESIGYMLIYLMRGNLPWQQVKVDNKKDNYLKVAQMKNDIRPEKLCENLPIEFAHYLRYVKNLKFEEEPNYQYLRNLFVQMMRKQGFEETNCFFSWVNLNNINIRYIKRQINLSKKSCSRSRVINKIRKTLENSEKSRSENKNDYNLSDCCGKKNNKYIHEKNSNKFNINKKVKNYLNNEYFNQEKYNLTTDINTIGNNNSLEKINLTNNKSLTNNNIKNLNDGSNHNMIKINNQYLNTPLAYSGLELNNLHNRLLGENDKIIKQNIKYNNLKGINNNHFTKIIPLRTNNSNNTHKRISSINNLYNKKELLINNTTVNNNTINNNSLINKKKNIIIINNNIYPNNVLPYNNTLENIEYKQKNFNNKINNIEAPRMKKINDKNNIRKLRLFNLITHKNKNKDKLFQEKTEIQNNNEDLIKEINKFNRRYNNQLILEKKNIKRINIPHINHLIRSSDNKKPNIKRIKKHKYNSPNNYCNVF